MKGALRLEKLEERWMAGACGFALCCTLLQTGAAVSSTTEVGGVSTAEQRRRSIYRQTRTKQTEKN